MHFLSGGTFDQLYTQRSDGSHEGRLDKKNDESCPENYSVPWLVCETSRQCEVSVSFPNKLTYRTQTYKSLISNLKASSK